MPLTATNGPFLLTPRPASGHEIMDGPLFEKLHLDVGILREALPAACAQVGSARRQLAASRGQQVAPAGSIQELERSFADHATVHGPDPLRFAEPSLDRRDDPFDGLKILGVAG